MSEWRIGRDAKAGGDSTEQQVVYAWRDLLARHATLACELDRVLHEHGLGMSDFEVLDRLADAGECVRMHNLAEAVHLSQSALSRLVSRLEREGLLTRTICDDDRRGIFVWLTDLGRRRHAAARPAQRAVLAAHMSISAVPMAREGGPSAVPDGGPSAVPDGGRAEGPSAVPDPTWESAAGQLALAEEN